MNNMLGFQDKTPKFVSNSPDGKGCRSACIQMVMLTHPGGHVFSFDEIDKISERKPGKPSWGFRITKAVAEAGFEVKSISTFSFRRFVREGGSYLLEHWGPKAGQYQIKNSDLPAAREAARDFLASNHVIVEERLPEMRDIWTHLNEGWTITPSVNWCTLYGRVGYSPHSVFVYACDEQTVHLHDPGLPAREAQKVPWPLFGRACSSPRRSVRDFICFRPIGNSQVSKPADTPRFF